MYKKTNCGLAKVIILTSEWTSIDKLCSDDAIEKKLLNIFWRFIPVVMGYSLQRHEQIKQTNIVWISPEENSSKVILKIQSGRDFLANNLKKGQQDLEAEMLEVELLFEF